MRKKLLAFLALLTVIFAAPQAAKANTYYIDAATLGWSQAYMFYHNSSTNGKSALNKITGTTVTVGGVTLYKFETTWTDVSLAFFSDNTGYDTYWDINAVNVFDNSRVGILKSSSTGNWKLQNNYVYTLGKGNTILSSASYSSYYPTLYITGFGSWDPATSTTLDYNSTTKKYTKEITVPSSEKTFAISTTRSTSSSEWDGGFKNGRYKASGTLSNGVSRTISLDKETSISVEEAGTYILTVDLINKTIVINSAGPSLSTLELYNASGTKVATLTNNTAYTSLTPGSTAYYVKATWSDSTVEYYTHANFTANSSDDALTYSASAPASGFTLDNDNYSKVSLTVNVTAKQTAKATVAFSGSYPTIYLFNTNTPTLIGQMTRNGNLYTISDVSLTKDQYVIMSGQSTANWNNINGSRYAATSGDTDMPCNSSGVTYYTSDSGGAWKATQTGNYTITFDYSAMTFTATAGKPIKTVELFQNTTLLKTLYTSATGDFATHDLKAADFTEDENIYIKVTDSENEVSRYGCAVSANGTVTPELSASGVITVPADFLSMTVGAELNASKNVLTGVVITNYKADVITHAPSLDLTELTGTIKVATYKTSTPTAKTYYKVKTTPLPAVARRAAAQVSVPGAGKYAFEATDPNAETEIVLPANSTSYITWNADGSPQYLYVTATPAAATLHNPTSEITLLKITNSNTTGTTVGKFVRYANQPNDFICNTKLLKSEDTDWARYYVVMNGTKYSYDLTGTNKWIDGSWYNTFKNLYTGKNEMQSGEASNTVSLIVRITDAGVPSQILALKNNAEGMATITGNANMPNFPVMQEREGTTWTRPAVFLKGDYLNNNRIVPDWEMKYDTQASVGGKRVYTLKNITLRGTSNEDSKISGELTAVAIKPDGTSTSISATPSDLESGQWQFGRVYNATYTIEADGTTTSLVFEQVSKYPQFLSLVGYAYQQPINRDMPNTGQTYHNTADGWQEAWVLYENGYPLYDYDNNYMYSTQWPPREQNEVQFNAHSDAKTVDATSYPEYNVGMGSNNLIFEQDARGVKTGTEWMNLLRTESTNPDYKDYLPVAGRDGTGLDDLAASTKYVRYTIPYVWMLGATKVWTGWGSEPDGTTAEWDFHINWGNGDGFENNEGVALNANTDYDMVKNKGNFLFNKPTYFKSVEFFLPVNDSNEPTSDNAKLYTVETFANVQIDAKACNVGEGGVEGNYDHGSFTATALVPSGYTLVSYKVTRYDATKSTNENWVPANYKGGPTDGTGPIALSKTDGDVGFVSVGDISDGVNWTVEIDEDTKKLANGVYFYGIEMVLQATDGDQALKTVTAKSPNFRISLYDFEPEVIPLQLVELTDKGKDMISNPLAEYLTYPSESAAYLVASDGRAGYISIDDAMDILKDPETHVWTGKYYVRLFDVAAYEGTMKSELAADKIDSYQTPLEFTWTISRNKPTKVAATVHTNVYDEDHADTENYNAISAPTLKVGSANELGFIYDNEGLLDNISFRAKNEYSYHTVGNATDNSGTNYAKGLTNVHIARPYGCWFRYNYDQKATNLTSKYNKYIKVSAPSAYDVITEVAEPTAYDLYMKTADLDPRSLQCEFHFNRPNLSPAILAKYDIHYEVALVGGTDGTTDLLADNNSGTGMFYYYKDTSTTGDDTATTDDTYQVTATNVHPTQSIYPRFAVKSTKYVYNVTTDATKDLVANFGYQDRVTTNKIEGSYQTYDIYLEAPNKTVRQEATIENVYFLPLDPGKTDPATGYTNNGTGFTFRYQGHKDFVDPGDVIHDPSLNIDPRDRTEASIYLKNPTFYQMEIVNKTNVNDRQHYEFLVKHQHKATYDKDVMVGNNGTHDVKNFTGMVIGDGDPLVGNHIFKDMEVQDPNQYNFYIAPVYIFWHDVNVSGEDNSYSDLTPVNPKSATPAPRREAATTNNDATSANGSLNWTDASMTAVSFTPQYPMTGTDVSSLVSNNDGSFSAVTGGGATTSPVSLDDFTTGIEEAFAEIENGEAEYYTLQGFRVERPVVGEIYIVKRGNKTTKELIR